MLENHCHIVNYTGLLRTNTVILGTNMVLLCKKMPAAQAAGADPAKCNSTNRPNISIMRTIIGKKTVLKSVIFGTNTIPLGTNMVTLRNIAVISGTKTVLLETNTIICGTSTGKLAKIWS